jgi:hypothetical protein
MFLAMKTKITQKTIEMLGGHTPDSAGYVDWLFSICKKPGSISGSIDKNQQITLNIGRTASIVVPLDNSRSRFRMVCARLCAIANDVKQTGIYSGHAVVRACELDIHIDVENTLRSHYFRLESATYKKVNK